MTIKIITNCGDEIFYKLPIRLKDSPRSISIVEKGRILTQDELYPTTKPTLPSPVQPMTIPPATTGIAPALMNQVKPYAQVGVGTWVGLWLTEKDTFVEVVSNDEAYFLRENGSRLVKGSINRSGVIVIDGQESCHLQERRIGTEPKSKYSGKSWPTPLGR